MNVKVVITLSGSNVIAIDGFGLAGQAVEVEVHQTHRDHWDEGPQGEGEHGPYEVAGQKYWGDPF